MPSPDLGFIHRFVPAARPGLPALLLLHGTGGDENNLVPLGAVLPFEPDALPDLKATPVLLLSGAADPIVPVASRDRLAAVLIEAGAAVSYKIVAAGHNLMHRDLTLAGQWLENLGLENFGLENFGLEHLK